MAQVINTNSISLLAQNNLNKSQSALGTAIERLSSGLRINSAKDDAAGQAISNRFTSNINGLTQASRNANDGISLAQTTEGALDEINSNLQAVRTLTVQSQTGTNSASDLQSIQDEVTQRLSEVDRISQQTDFNGVKVLSSDKSLSIQVGSNDGETISIALSKIDSKTLGLGTFNVNGTQGQTTTVKAGTLAATTNLADVAASTAVNIGGTSATTAASVSFTDASGKSVTGGTLVSNGTNYFVKTADALYSADSISSDGKTVTVGDKTSGTFAPNGTTAANADFTPAATVSNLADVTSGTKVAFGGGSATTTAATTFQDASGNEITGGTLVSDGSNYYVKTADALYSAGSISSDGTTVTVGNKTSGSFAANKTTAANADFTAGTTASTIEGTTVKSISIADTSSTKSSAVTGGTLVQDKDGNYFVQDSNGNSYAATVSIDDTTGVATVSADSSKKIANAGTNDSLATLDKALSTVDTMRSNLGAVQNRFDSTINNLASTTSNLSEAQSRIQDADYATEVSNMSKAQILQQAGTSVLAQANQVPQTVLSLLK